MNHFTLWINAGTFAVCAVSLVLSAGVYARKPSSWMKPYLLYHGAYALWLLIFTYYYFRLVYLPSSPPFVETIVTTLRIVISAAILWAYPSLILHTIHSETLSRGLRIARMAMLILIVVTTSVLVSVRAHELLLRIVTLCFNGYLLLLTVLFLIRTMSSPRTTPLPMVMPLYWVSLAFYLYAVIAGSILAATGISALMLSALSASIYCLPWSVVMGWRLFGHLSAPPNLGLRESVAKTFGFTPRERDVVDQVLQGLPNKHIAKALDVSLRTVETHLYNAFRKCGARSRTELIRRIQSKM